MFRPRERAFKQFKCPRPQCVNEHSLISGLLRMTSVALFVTAPRSEILNAIMQPMRLRCFVFYVFLCVYLLILTITPQISTSALNYPFSDHLPSFFIFVCFHNLIALFPHPCIVLYPHPCIFSLRSCVSLYRHPYILVPSYLYFCALILVFLCALILTFLCPHLCILMCPLTYISLCPHIPISCALFLLLFCALIPLLFMCPYPYIFVCLQYR